MISEKINETQNYYRLTPETIENIVKPLESVFLSVAKDVAESNETNYNLKKENKWRFFNDFYHRHDKDIEIQYDNINVGFVVNNENNIELTFINYGDGENIVETINKDKNGKLEQVDPIIKNSINFILKRLRDNPTALKNRGGHTYL